MIACLVPAATPADGSPADDVLTESIIEGVELASPRAAAAGIDLVLGVKPAGVGPTVGVEATGMMTAGMPSCVLIE